MKFLKYEKLETALEISLQFCQWNKFAHRTMISYLTPFTVLFAHIYMMTRIFFFNTYTRLSIAKHSKLCMQNICLSYVFYMKLFSKRKEIRVYIFERSIP